MPTRNTLRALTVLLFASLALPCDWLFAQSTGIAPATVQGRVTDSHSGAPLAGAEVELRGASTLVLRSDGAGRWRAEMLAPGQYVLRARLVGYAPRATDVEARAGRATERDLALDPMALPLDQVVITASRRLQRLKDTPVTTELVSRREIEQTGASDLASILTEQTGIELQGGHPAGAGVMLQGIGSERVLILLDGQPIAGRISGVFDVSRIPVSAVDRVEIVKGPQSTLYGSDAMGGVINVITRIPPPGTFGASATVLTGTQGRLDGSAGVVGGRGPLSSSIDISHRTIENTPGQQEEDGALATRTDAAAKLRWVRNATLTIDAGVLALDERQRWRSGTAYNFGDNRQWSGHLTGSWQRGRHRLVPTLSGSVFNHLARGSSLPKPIAGDPGDRQIQRRYEAELLYGARMGAHLLDAGVELRREETRAANVIGGERSLSSVEPFAQLELNAAALSVVPGVRVSWNEQWGTHVTPRLAARYRATDALTLRASAGAGYRAPDFKELYMFFQNESANYSVLGNAELRPETSRNLTAGAEWAAVRAYARGQLFWNEFRDFIETRVVSAPDAPLVFRYDNVDDGSTRGLELEGGVTAARVRLDAGYALLGTENRATGQPLLGRPEHSGRVSVGAAAPFGLRATVTGVYTGRTPMERDEATGAVTGWRDAFLRADVRLVQRLPWALELALGVDNITDARPEQWAGFTRRHIYTAVSWTTFRPTAQ